MTNRTTDIVALKKLMVEKGLDKICDLSGVSGVSRNTLSLVLKGKAQPSAEVMNKLITTLEISPKDAGEIFFSTNLRTA